MAGAAGMDGAELAGRFELKFELNDDGSSSRGSVSLLSGQTFIYRTPCRQLHLHHGSTLQSVHEFDLVGRIDTTFSTQGSEEFVQIELRAFGAPIIIRQVTTFDGGVPVGYRLNPSEAGESTVYCLTLGSRLQFEGTNATLAVAVSRSNLQVGSSPPAQAADSACQIPESNTVFFPTVASTKASNSTPDVSASLKCIEETPTAIRTRIEPQNIPSTLGTAPFSTAKDRISPESRPAQPVSSVPTELVLKMPPLPEEEQPSHLPLHHGMQDSEATDSGSNPNATDDEMVSVVTSVPSTARSSTKRARPKPEHNEDHLSSTMSKKTKLDLTNNVEHDSNNDIPASHDPESSHVILNNVKVERTRSSADRKQDLSPSEDAFINIKPKLKKYTGRKSNSSTEVTKSSETRAKNGPKVRSARNSLEQTPSVVASPQNTATPITPVSNQTSPASSSIKVAGEGNMTIAFTASACDNKPNIRKFMSKNGITVTTKIDEHLDYLCVGGGQLKKTPKLILALALGKSIINDQWILDSTKRGEILEVERYFASDPTKEAELGVPQGWSAGAARDHLLKGRVIYVTPTLKEWYGEDWTAIQRIAKAAGAKKISSGAAREIRADRDNVVCLGLSKGDRDAIALAEKDVRVYDKDLLTLAVLRRRLELDSDQFAIKPAPPKVAGRKKTKALQDGE